MSAAGASAAGDLDVEHAPRRPAPAGSPSGALVAPSTPTACTCGSGTRCSRSRLAGRSRVSAAELDDRQRRAGAVGAGRHRVHVGELGRGEAALDRGGPDRTLVRPCGRSSRPSTATTASASPAGTDSAPVRWRTRCPSGIRACCSSAANSSASVPTGPATRIRRDAGSTRTTSAPAASTADRTSSTSAGSAPYRLGQLVAAQPLAGRQWGAPPQHDRDLDPLARVDRSDDLGARDRRPRRCPGPVRAARSPSAHPAAAAGAASVSGTGGRWRRRPCRSRPRRRR